MQMRLRNADDGKVEDEDDGEEGHGVVVESAEAEEGKLAVEDSETDFLAIAA